MHNACIGGLGNTSSLPILMINVVFENTPFWALGVYGRILKAPRPQYTAVYSGVYGRILRVYGRILGVFVCTTWLFQVDKIPLLCLLCPSCCILCLCRTISHHLKPIWAHTSLMIAMYVSICVHSNPYYVASCSPGPSFSATMTDAGTHALLKKWADAVALRTVHRGVYSPDSTRTVSWPSLENCAWSILDTPVALVKLTHPGVAQPHSLTDPLPCMRATGYCRAMAQCALQNYSAQHSARYGSGSLVCNPMS